MDLTLKFDPRNANVFGWFNLQTGCNVTRPAVKNKGGHMKYRYKTINMTVQKLKNTCTMVYTMVYISNIRRRIHYLRTYRTRSEYAVAYTRVTCECGILSRLVVLPHQCPYSIAILSTHCPFSPFPPLFAAGN